MDFLDSQGGDAGGPTLAGNAEQGQSYLPY